MQRIWFHLIDKPLRATDMKSQRAVSAEWHPEWVKIFILFYFFFYIYVLIDYFLREIK